MIIRHFSAFRMRHVGFLEDNSPKTHEFLGYALDDVESEYLDFELVDSAAEAIDFKNASDFTKLAWALMICQRVIVQDE